MKKSDWTKALTSMKETLEPPPKSERKARSRALVEDYASEPLPANDSSIKKHSSPAPPEEIFPIAVPIPGVPGVSPVSPQTDDDSRSTANRRKISRPKSKSKGQTKNAAPARDFTRVANSIVREAVAGGQFKGKSKQLYDYLYSQTRGYITPRYTARLTRTQIMAGAGIGSINTFMSHLAHLKEKGLLKVQFINGSQGGNYYTIYLPEEIGSTDQYQVYQGYHQEYQYQELVGVPVSTSDTGDTGQLPLNSVIYGASKTSFKTLEIDDELASALSDLNRIFGEVTTSLTGHSPKAVDREQWAELAEVLVTELQIAATRTTVSSVPAFLAEHLRRRLWKKEKVQLAEPGVPTEASTANAFTPEQIQQCQDCGGSGFYYPSGFDGGVAKCKHNNLTS
jgi:hypothetical protein